MRVLIDKLYLFQRIGSLVPRVLTTLMNSFKDPSWAVRDAACSGKRLPKNFMITLVR